jgi:hypothetical protein
MDRMFNLNIFREVQPYHKPDYKEIFKGYKVSEFPANKKRVHCISWNKQGTNLISGSADSGIKVSIFSDISDSLKYYNF